MRKILEFMQHKKRQVPIIGYLMDAIDFFGYLHKAIKERNPRYLLKPVMKVTYVCIILTGVLYFAFLSETIYPIICLPTFLLVTAIAEIIYTLFIHRISLYDVEHRVFRSENHPYGDQRFMNEDDEDEIMIRSKNINNFKEMILGIDLKGYMIAKREDLDFGNSHVIAVGNSGTKKGVGIVVPRTLQMIYMGRSGVISSTKGDNFALLYHIAKKSGYIVRVLTLRPGEIDHSDGFDILKNVNGSTDIAQTIAECIINNTSPGERVDYWYRGERHLLFTLIVYFSIIGRTIFDLYNFLFTGLEGIEAALDSLTPEHPAYGPYRIFKGGDGRGMEAKYQVVQGLGIRLASFMSDTNIKNLLRHDDIRFSDLANKKCLIFVVVSDKTPVFKALSSSFFSLLFFELGRIADKNGGTLDNPVEIMIDEAFACGPIPGYADIISTARGYGINITTILQSIPQLKQMYPESYDAIFNDCGIKILIHTDDEITARKFSNLTGTFTYESENRDYFGRKTGSKDNTLPLMSVSEVLGKSIDKQLVYITGAKHPCIMLYKQLWYANWPGSRMAFYNKKDERTYLSHPLLEHYEYFPINKRIPRWKKKLNKLRTQNKKCLSKK